MNPAKAGAGDTAPASQLAVPMTADQEQAVRAWLALIEETAPGTIAEVLGRCQRDADARAYFVGRAADNPDAIAAEPPAGG